MDVFPNHHFASAIYLSFLLWAFDKFRRGEIIMYVKFSLKNSFSVPKIFLNILLDDWGFYCFFLQLSYSICFGFVFCFYLFGRNSLDLYNSCVPAFQSLTWIINSFLQGLLGDMQAGRPPLVQLQLPLCLRGCSRVKDPSVL